MSAFFPKYNYTVEANEKKRSRLNTQELVKAVVRALVKENKTTPIKAPVTYFYTEYVCLCIRTHSDLIFMPIFFVYFTLRVRLQDDIRRIGKNRVEDTIDGKRGQSTVHWLPMPRNTQHRFSSRCVAIWKDLDINPCPAWGNHATICRMPLCRCNNCVEYMYWYVVQSCDSM